MPESLDMTGSIARLNSLVDIGRNALWNYVSLIVYLRMLRRCRVIFNLLPILFGSFGSWSFLTENAIIRPYVALLPFLAGVIPLIYFASGLEETINHSTKLAGQYRKIEAEVRDLIFAYAAYSAADIREKHGHILSHYVELKGEAHTVPRWAFGKAETLIARRDYVPIGFPDSGLAAELPPREGASPPGS